jgi:hypothetical protein
VNYKKEIETSLIHTYYAFMCFNCTYKNKNVVKKGDFLYIIDDDDDIFSTMLEIPTHSRSFSPCLTPHDIDPAELSTPL